MICPHCKKPIHKGDNKALKKEVLAWSAKGYSARDIEALTQRQVSFSTAAKWVREAKSK